MIIYALAVYATMSVALIVSFLSFYKPVLYFYNPLLKALLICVAFAISLVHITGFSIASLLYSLFDMPSFSVLVVSIVSITRFFIPNIGFIISYKGFIALFVLWLLLVLNGMDIWQWAYGGVSYELAICSLLIGIIYCIDRVCAVLLLISFAIWLCFPYSTNVYNAIIDCTIAMFGFAMQAVPPSRVCYRKFSKRLNY